MRLENDPNTLWVAVESPFGSALVVFGSPDSDSDLLFEKIMMPFESASSPFSRDIVTRGNTEDEVATILDSCEVVPVSEFAPFRRQEGDSGNFQTMPITARRAAQGWKRLSRDLYVTTLSEPEQVDVYLMLTGGELEMLTAVGEGQAPAWVNSLVAQGDHRIEIIDPTVMIATPLPLPVDAASLMANASALVARVAQAFAEAQEASAARLPDAPPESHHWKRLASLPDGATPTRAWHLPSVLPSFGYIERVRESTQEDASFESTESLATRLRSERSTGFEYAWRGADDGLLSPTWLTLRSAVVDPTSGNFVGAGHLTHEVWDMSPALDLGALDGRNLSFSGEGHPGGLLWPAQTLYVGSVRTGVLVPLDVTVNALSVDFNSTNSEIALWHHLGSSTGAVSVISADGSKRLLTVVEGLAGNESIRYSPDGEWLLVPRSRDSVLIEVSTGRWLVLEVANTGWWPLAESALLSIEHSDGNAIPVLYSLTENSFTTRFPMIHLDVPLLETFPFVWGPEVSTDGQEILAHSPVGVSVEYQAKHGTGSHVVRFTLASGEGTLVVDPFLNQEETAERDVAEVRWNSASLPVNSLTLHPDLIAQLKPPVTEHEWLTPGRWLDEAERVMINSLNMAIRQTEENGSAGHLLPEILIALAAIGQVPEIWARKSEWLTGLRDATASRIAAGALVGDVAVFWRKYGEAILAIEAGHADFIDPIGAGWA
ncbi:MAG TPA: hypothetical protein PJ998_06660 [Terrimesophilobacter sp.]|nr:hypothetical protein [Terrimesophilobacter sp.]